jgi:hypothetical protein
MGTNYLFSSNTNTSLTNRPSLSRSSPTWTTRTPRGKAPGGRGWLWGMTESEQVGGGVPSGQQLRTRRTYRTGCAQQFGPPRRPKLRPRARSEPYPFWGAKMLTDMSEPYSHSHTHTLTHTHNATRDSTVVTASLTVTGRHSSTKLLLYQREFAAGVCGSQRARRRHFDSANRSVGVVPSSKCCCSKRS